MTSIELNSLPASGFGNVGRPYLVPPSNCISCAFDSPACTTIKRCIETLYELVPKRFQGVCLVHESVVRARQRGLLIIVNRLGLIDPVFWPSRPLRLPGCYRHDGEFSWLHITILSQKPYVSHLFVYVRCLKDVSCLSFRER